jgi:hypothetical protein
MVPTSEGPPIGPEDAKRVEQELLDAVSKAKADYESAKAKSKMLMATTQDIGSYRTPDGAGAIREAARLEVEAMHRYADALRKFSSFILASTGRRLRRY